MQDCLKKGYCRTNPKENANILEKLFFWIEIKSVVKYLRKTSENLHAPLKKHESKRLSDKLEEAWRYELYFQKKPSLARALMSTFGREFAVYGIIYFPIHTILVLLQPYFLNRLLEYYDPRKATTLQLAYFDASMLTLLLFVEVLSNNFCNFGLATLGMEVCIACGSLVYRKLLKLRIDTFRNVNLGQIINLLSNDVKRFETVFTVLHVLWFGPLKLIIATCYLVVTMEPTALAGIVLIIGSILLQIYFSTKIASQRRKVALKTDYRICLMNDLITNIKTIKMNTWERVFAEKVNKSRNVEIQEIKKGNYFRMVNNNFKFFLVEMCSYFCILAAISKQVQLTSEYVFVVRNIYDMLKNTVVTQLPDAITQCAESRISLKRVQEFLTSDIGSVMSPVGVKDGCLIKSLRVLRKESVGICLKNISVASLQDISLEILPGEIVVVTGFSGKGKSTLLQLILGEFQPSSGNIKIHGSVSYASQEPWLFPSTIKQNIFFGQEIDDKKYIKIIKICALGEDLSLLPDGDETRIGDKDVVLSSGLKSKIHLARALYKNADIYLLDEPLAQVENVMMETIFQELTAYLKHKCVLIITHHYHCLQNVDRIYFLRRGMLVRWRIGEFNKLGHHHKKNLLMKRKNHNERKFKLPEAQKFRKFVNVPSEALTNYCQFGGNRFCICLILFMFILVQCLYSGTDYFISFWVNIEDEPLQFSTGIRRFFRTDTNLYFYTLLLALLVLTVFVSTNIFLNFCTKASQKLHDATSIEVIYATMKFHTNQTCGNILSRFSTDLGLIDENMPLQLKNAIELTLALCATGVIISVVNYTMILSTLAFFLICYYYNLIFSSTKVERLVADAKSQVYTHIDATMKGMPTIRGSGNEQTLQHEFDTLQDYHTSAFYLNMSITNAFSFWLDLTRVLYTTVVVFSFFFIRPFVGDVGLAITQSMQSSIVQDAVKAWNSLDESYNSIDRLVEYTDLPTEPSKDINTHNSWPKFGNIKFQKVSLKYFAESSYVLKNVTFNIKAGEKVGIFGRNCSGKTSLLAALFRLFHFEGTITIDGSDIKSVPLQVLRSQILAIPQKPVFLFGTIRENLDPFGKFEDFELWRALDDVGLREYISGLALGLETRISDDLSLNPRQKQLLYLASGVLRKVKIVVLLNSSGFNERTVRKIFKKCTIVTLGNNLQSFRNFDNVLILEDGFITEYRLTSSR